MSTKKQYRTKSTTSLKGSKMEVVQSPTTSEWYTHAYILQPGDLIHIKGIPFEVIRDGLVGSNTQATPSQVLDAKPGTVERYVQQVERVTLDMMSVRLEKVERCIKHVESTLGHMVELHHREVRDIKALQQRLKKSPAVTRRKKPKERKA